MNGSTIKFVGLSNRRTIELSDYRTVGPSNRRTIELGLSDYRTVGLSNRRTIELSIGPPSEHMLMSVSTLIWSDLTDSCVSVLHSEFLLVGWQSLTHIMFCLVSIFSISSPALFDFGFLHSWLLAFRSTAIVSGVLFLLLSSIF